jgi:hypothetical protein
MKLKTEKKMKRKIITGESGKRAYDLTAYLQKLESKRLQVEVIVQTSTENKNKINYVEEK